MATLAEKHIVVVGGSRGIGAAAALKAAIAGANVSIIYRSNVSAADAVVASIESVGQRCVAVAADASVEHELEAAFGAILNTNGPIHGLVISAGIFEGKPLAEMTTEFWDRVMSLNLRSTFLSMKCSAPRFADRASVVIYTSTAGQRGSAVFSAYAASKAAQIMFMRSMALELAPRVRVNCIAPAWTETDMADSSLTALGRDKVSAGFPLGRIGQPTDVANATVFLLSDEAEFITGSTITVDGGMDMRG